MIKSMLLTVSFAALFAAPFAVDHATRSNELAGLNNGVVGDAIGVAWVLIDKLVD